MTDIKEITDTILVGGSLTADDIIAATERYPYYILPLLALLKEGSGLDADTRQTLHARLTASTGDLEPLYHLLGPCEAVAPGFYPPRNATPTTESTIDTFLSTYGSSSPAEEEMLERMIFNPTVDYSQILAREEQQSVPTPDEAAPGSHDDMLNAFIIKQKQSAGVIDDESTLDPVPPREQRSDNPPVKPADNSLLSASLAKIFIKQGHYERAHEIITQLSLNYPEKSIYFADQLRYLTKLIAIKQSRAGRGQQAADTPQ